MDAPERENTQPNLSSLLAEIQLQRLGHWHMECSITKVSLNGWWTAMFEAATLADNLAVEEVPVPTRTLTQRKNQSINRGTAEEAVFVARGLSKIYRMGDVEVHVLPSVDLELYRGELVVLLGASGSGKSTLLNILGGLDVPTSGEVCYRDHNLTVDDDAELTRYRREHVGFVFQFYNLIPSLTAYENVELVTDIASDPMPPADALQLVGLGDRMHHFPAQLSGGEQQRVAIARAVAKRPEVLLCDEPTGALDYATGKLVLEVIERINEELGTTTAIITHNAAIADMADRVLRMRSGEIAEEHRNEKRASPAELVW